MGSMRARIDPLTQSVNCLLLVFRELKELTAPGKPTTSLSTLFSSSMHYGNFLNEGSMCIDLHSGGSEVPVFSLITFSL